MNSTGKRIIEETRMNCESQTTEETVITGKQSALAIKALTIFVKTIAFMWTKQPWSKSGGNPGILSL